MQCWKIKKVILQLSSYISCSMYKQSKMLAQTNTQIYVEWWDFTEVGASVAVLWDLKCPFGIK